jgi:hypothetical protein
MKRCTNWEEEYKKTNRDAAVTANDGDNDGGCFFGLSVDLGDKGGCADNIEGRDAEEPSITKTRNETMYRR